MRRLVLVTGAAVFVESIFFSAIAPLLPHYTQQFGLSKFGAGVLVGSYPAGALAAALPGGALASRLGVKPTMLAGLVLLAALSLVFGFADSIWLADAARAGQGVGAALAWTGALAWLVEMAPRGQRGELIGWTTAAATAGTLFGPVVGAVASLAGTRTVFGTVALVGVTLASWVAQAPGPRTRSRQSLMMLMLALRRPGVSAGLWLLALPSLMFGVIEVLGPLRLSRLGWSGSSIGAVFLVAALFEIVGSVLSGRWADRSGRHVPLRACLVASAIASLLLPLGQTTWILAVLLVLAGIAYGAFFAPAMALLSDEAESAGLEQSLGFSLLNIAWAPGNLIGAAAGGAIAGAVGDTAPYLTVAGLAALTFAGLARIWQTTDSAIETS